MRDGYRNQCKACVSKRYKQWREKNIDKCKKYGRQQYEANKEKRKEYYQKWKAGNREKTKEYGRKWRDKYPERHKQWCEANPEKRREMMRRSRKNKILAPKDILNRRMKTAIKKSLKGNKNGRRWESLVGYTADALKKHIEKQFTEGMTWKKFLNGEIHLDHIIPKSAFNYETPEDIDFKKAWELKNLQPLWATENLKKHNKLNSHFQPSFAFGGE
jgi:superfamily II DNA helicase RecQ